MMMTKKQTHLTIILDRTLYMVLRFIFFIFVQINIKTSQNYPLLSFWKKKKSIGKYILADFFKKNQISCFSFVVK